MNWRDIKYKKCRQRRQVRVHRHPDKMARLDSTEKKGKPHEAYSVFRIKEHCTWKTTSKDEKHLQFTFDK